MFEYQVEQKILEIGGVKIGGQPGVNPTVLVGSIFYTGDRLVLDPKSGRIDVAGTEDVLQNLEETSEKTGLPSMLDVVAISPEAADRYIRLLADMTDSPLMIDGSDQTAVNLAGVNAASDAGLLHRVVLNSLTPESSGEVYSRFQDTGLKNVVLLTFSSEAMASATKRVELADSLIKKAKNSGFTNLLIDTGVADLLTLGLACKALQTIKEKQGYPVGCGAHNAVSTWRGLVPKFGDEAKKPAFVGSNLMPVVLGADFVLYGPVQDAPIVYPSIAMIDVALSGILLETRTPIDKTHPRYRIS
ncbi:MAG: tetrahydromethanopterin S-methyltransferase subunit H [Candidatus Thorarchaeota archaeon]|nr:MAG: tetrahydromethanopterin S-methyltransferase subunit H [Candidatus Thorarchaeota archaeon]